MTKEVDTVTANIKENIRYLKQKIQELLKTTKAIASGMHFFVCTKYFPRAFLVYKTARERM
jgi:hypothetical protein